MLWFFATRIRIREREIKRIRNTAIMETCNLDRFTEIRFSNYNYIAANK